MPPYAFLAGRPLDYPILKDEMEALKTEGVPYTEEMIKNVEADAAAQADPDSEFEEMQDAYNGSGGPQGNGPGPRFRRPARPADRDGCLGRLPPDARHLVDFSTYQADDLQNQR